MTMSLSWQPCWAASSSCPSSPGWAAAATWRASTARWAGGWMGGFGRGGARVGEDWLPGCGWMGAVCGICLAHSRPAGMRTHRPHAHSLHACSHTLRLRASRRQPRSWRPLPLAATPGPTTPPSRMHQPSRANPEPPLAASAAPVCAGSRPNERHRVGRSVAVNSQLSPPASYLIPARFQAAHHHNHPPLLTPWPLH